MRRISQFDTSLSGEETSLWGVLTAAPQVAEKFRKTDDYKKLVATGARLSSICPLMYTNNPICGGKPIVTSSNKLRTYSKAKYMKDEDILKLITGQEA